VIKKVSKGWFFRTKSSVTILNGIDTDKYVAPDRVGDLVKQELVVGLVARFRPQKRVDRWVEVAAEIRKQTDKVFFIMVGDGPEDNMLREKIKEIDIFLLTSDFEGLPLALLEAMSCGCVPVISNVGGIKQLSFKNFGHKFDSFNAKEIADVVKKYLYNTPMFKEESLRARNFVVENYSLQKQLKEIIQLYKESK
jgi:glycosyltransferase involved in cell wall biosynthesis